MLLRCQSAVDSTVLAVALHVLLVWGREARVLDLRVAGFATPVFDLERFGIHFVASPRHADLLLVTGPVTRNMEIALRRTYEAALEPRVVVAVGLWMQWRDLR
jgi:Ni,Fe-hydrogenase III small subunit